MPPCITKDELEQMYTVEKKTDQQIADIVGCWKQTVYVLRKRYGIKKIPAWSRHVCEPSQRQLDIIYGTLVGDGYVDTRNLQRNSESNLQIKHGPKQREYVSWKYGELQNLCNSPPKKVGGQYRFRTFAHPFFTALRAEFYGSGRKALTKSILEKLSPLSIAVWFMDDGTNLNNGSTLRFSTCSFNDSEHYMMIEFFREVFDVEMKVSHYDSYPILRVAEEHKSKFVNLIRIHVPQCMTYKLRGH